MLQLRIVRKAVYKLVGLLLVVHPTEIMLASVACHKIVDVEQQIVS